MCICNRTMTVKSILICHSKFHWIPSSDCHAKGRIRGEKERMKKKMRTKAVFNWSTMFAKHVIKHLDAIGHKHTLQCVPLCQSSRAKPGQTGPSRADFNNPIDIPQGILIYSTDCLNALLFICLPLFLNGTEWPKCFLYKCQCDCECDGKRKFKMFYRKWRLKIDLHTLRFGIHIPLHIEYWEFETRGLPYFV